MQTINGISVRAAIEPITGEPLVFVNDLCFEVEDDRTMVALVRTVDAVAGPVVADVVRRASLSVNAEVLRRREAADAPVAPAKAARRPRVDRDEIRRRCVAYDERMLAVTAYS